MASATAYAADTFGVEPEILYTMTGFIRVSGISKSRISSERLKGNPLPIVKAGRRAFVKGEAGISWIEGLSARTAESQAPATL